MNTEAMQIDVIRTLPEWHALQSEWNALLDRSITCVPFLRHEYLSAWWQHLGGCREWPQGELHAITGRVDGRLVAAAPLFLSEDREGRPVVALIGSDAISDYLDILAEPAFLPPFADLLLDRLSGDVGPEWKAMHLYNLREDSPTVVELRRAAASRGMHFYLTALSACCRVPLPHTWNAYLAEQLEKKARHELRRKLARLEKVPGVRWYFVENSAVAPRDVADLLRIMAENDDKRDALTPGFSAQLADIVRAAARGGWLRLGFLEIEKQRAAVCLAFDLGNCLWIYNHGMSKQFGHLSPGQVLLAYVMQWAIRAGRTTVDFLRGDQSYKLSLGAVRRNIMLATIARYDSTLMGNHLPMKDILPDDDVLAAGLDVAAIESRTGIDVHSSADCEIVTCRLHDSTIKTIFCKYGPLAEVEGPTHRFGAAYEAHVYGGLLGPWAGQVPQLHGVFLDETTGLLVLALEHLSEATSVHRLTNPKAALIAAARWIARFQVAGETAEIPSFLHRYDTEFYRLWAQRAAQYTLPLHDRYPWLPELCEVGQRRLPAILTPATIIHGEYQANNILHVEGRNVPVDWESAALAAGEIDLASLTWGWDDDLRIAIEREYSLARWPDGIPSEFPLRLAAARLYLQLRWLGDEEGEVNIDESSIDWDELEAVAKRFEALDR